jgi:hypothetical protein
MTKTFLAYRFTGEDKVKLEEALSLIRGGLEVAGHEVTCIFWHEEIFRKNNFTTEQIYQYGLKELDDCDAFFSYISSENPSKGMELELNYAIKNNKKRILAIKKGLKMQKFRNSAQEIIEYETHHDLLSSLERINFVSNFD